MLMNLPDEAAELFTRSAGTFRGHSSMAASATHGVEDLIISGLQLCSTSLQLLFSFSFVSRFFLWPLCRRATNDKILGTGGMSEHHLASSNSIVYRFRTYTWSQPDPCLP